MASDKELYIHLFFILYILTQILYAQFVSNMLISKEFNSKSILSVNLSKLSINLFLVLSLVILALSIFYFCIFLTLSIKGKIVISTLYLITILLYCKSSKLMLKVNDGVLSNSISNFVIFIRNRLFTKKRRLVITLLLPILLTIFAYTGENTKLPLLFFLCFVTILSYIRYIDRTTETIDNNIQVKHEDPSDEKIKRTNIKLDTEQRIISKLNDFEKGLDFLRKDMDIQTLAKILETNTKYLSKVINQYKKMNFNNYINFLRIGYALKRLNDNNDIFKTYTVEGMTYECGFNSRVAFSRAFKAETNMNPSEYIESLN